MLSIAFIMAFVVAAVSMILGIFIYSEVSDGIGSSFGGQVLIANGTAGGLIVDSPLYGCETYDDKISLLDKLTGSVISSVTIPNANSCLGLAVDPTTGIYYVLSEFHNISGFGFGGVLSTVDPATGVGTAVANVTGSCGLDCASIAFDSNGDLFLLKDQFLTYNIYKVDKTNGSELSSCSPTPNRLSTLALNYDNNKMYRTFIDTGDPTDSSRLEVIDPNTCVSSETVTIDMGLYNVDGLPRGFGYNTVDGLFYMSGQLGVGAINDHYTLTTGGVATKLADDVVGSGVYQGLAFAHTTGVASPPIYEDTTPEAFTQADSIAFTILAIIPITLFFGLFTILSPRIDGEI